MVTGHIAYAIGGYGATGRISYVYFFFLTVSYSPVQRSDRDARGFHLLTRYNRYSYTHARTRVPDNDTRRDPSYASNIRERDRWDASVIRLDRRVRDYYYGTTRLRETRRRAIGGAYGPERRERFFFFSKNVSEIIRDTIHTHAYTCPVTFELFGNFGRRTRFLVLTSNDNYRPFCEPFGKMACPKGEMDDDESVE